MTALAPVRLDQDAGGITAAYSRSSPAPNNNGFGRAGYSFTRAREPLPASYRAGRTRGEDGQHHRRALPWGRGCAVGETLFGRLADAGHGAKHGPDPGGNRYRPADKTRTATARFSNAPGARRDTSTLASVRIPIINSRQSPTKITLSTLGVALPVNGI